MYNIFVKEHTLPFLSVDSRSLSTPITIGAASTGTHIVFSSNVLSQTAGKWDGAMFVIMSGANKGIACHIASSTNSGSDLESLDLAEEIIFDIDNEYFMLIKRDETQNVSYGNVRQLDKYVDSFSVTTSIDKGFDNLSLQINNRFSGELTSLSLLLGNNIQVYKNGYLLFEGIVADIDYVLGGGTISCLGYRNTFAWYGFDRIYNGDATNTAPKILKDVMYSNPYISNLKGGIDRGGLWDTAQQAIGGIGPRDYSKQYISCADVIDEILAMGNFGVSYDSVYLQVYEGALAVIKKVDKTSAPDYVITRKNFATGGDGYAIKTSMMEAYTEINASYNNSSGATLYTPSMVNVSMLRKMGSRKKMITTGNGGLLEKSAMVRVANNDFGTYLSASDFKIFGTVSLGGSNTFSDSAFIRAGDMVSIEKPSGFDSMFRNTQVDVTKFVVGKTTYDSKSELMTIAPVENILQSTILAARLKV